MYKYVKASSALHWPNGKSVDLRLARDENDLEEAVAYMYGISRTKAWRQIAENLISTEDLQRCIDYWAFKDSPQG